MTYMDGIMLELLGNSPALLAWLICIILSAFLVGRGQGTAAEKLLLLSCSLLFLSQISRPFLPRLSLWLLYEQGVSKVIAGYVNWLINIMSFAGIVYLVCALLIRLSAGEDTQEGKGSKTES